MWPFDVSVEDAPCNWLDAAAAPPANVPCNWLLSATTAENTIEDYSENEGTALSSCNWLLQHSVPSETTDVHSLVLRCPTQNQRTASGPSVCNWLSSAGTGTDVAACNWLRAKPTCDTVNRWFRSDAYTYTQTFLLSFFYYSGS